MKGLRLVIQNSDNQELFVKRIALPFKGADEFANITKALYTDLCVVVLAYQRSQEEGVSFKAMMDHVKKQTAEEVRKLKSRHLGDE